MSTPPRTTTVSYDLDTAAPTVAGWRAMLSDLPDQAIVRVSPIMGGDQRDPYPVGLRIRITIEEEA
ncbi:hypothetical protein [Cellulosimicrobium funkei]|uniref:hypothetical protein n=1 Tax=Cellulosimicrobium funkei TaxID=264251 RepID=UPI0034305FEC